VKATFAAGCFWHVEELFRKLNGIQDVIVGYTGGNLENPIFLQMLLNHELKQDFLTNFLILNILLCFHLWRQIFLALTLPRIKLLDKHFLRQIALKINK